MTDWLDERLLDAAYGEALDLLEQTRTMVQSGSARQLPPEATPLDRIRMARDMSRLTSLATCCMGLLLLYQAVREGQMDREEMREESRRLFAEVGANLPDRSAPHPFAPDLERLVSDGHDLFRRLERLQALFDGGGAGQPS